MLDAEVPNASSFHEDLGGIKKCGNLKSKANVVIWIIVQNLTRISLYQVVSAFTVGYGKRSLLI